MTTRVGPFQRKTSGTIFQAVLSSTPPAPVRLNPLVPAELELVIAKALEKDPAMRHQSAAEMRTDIPSSTASAVRG